jgi:mannose-6-phosphate isomerase-like protein (cupin superfamily)
MLNRKREVIKPWGREVIWAETKDYVGKLLYINEGCKLSLQYHEEKEETILVISGTLEVMVSGHGRRGISNLKLSEGETYHVTPNTIHRFAATCGTNVVLAEVSTNHLDDVVRLEDDYDRE